uniref:Uncharacterized protein n=1 Tax=Cucumis melo TaxID=3656 RepID=A0A9I9D6T8_CUCME
MAMCSARRSKDKLDDGYESNLVGESETHEQAGKNLMHKQKSTHQTKMSLKVLTNKTHGDRCQRNPQRIKGRGFVESRLKQ